MTELLTGLLLQRGLGEPQARLLARYCAMMLERNEVLNLTRITEPQDVADKHIMDSLAFSGLIPEGASVADVGTGAGFPGIPLAVLRPDLHIVLMDSVEKKLNFVREAAEKLSIKNVEVLCARAEEAELRGCFGAVVSRAVADMPVLAELCLPMAAVGGVLIAYKGAAAEQELARARRAIELLGGGEVRLVPGGPEGTEHFAIVIKKLRETPKKYPRRFAQIKKSPL